MAVKAVTKHTRISAFKARNVARHIQGRPALQALELLEFYPQKAARLIGKTLKSAIANAENNNALDPATLVVKEAVIGEGPTLKRFRPKARGSAGPIRKRTSHIRIILDEMEVKPEEKKKPAARRATKSDQSVKSSTGKSGAEASQ
ncbi:MAG: 50S ribosomal protein L22 [Candidatus Methylacidiphilales bacterium]